MYPIFVSDSVGYLSYLDYFDGIKNFSEWDNVRGIAYPLYLWLGEKIIGANATALNMTLYIPYFVMICYVYKIADMFIEECHSRRDYFMKYGPCAILFFHPYIYGYYHYVLTEALTLTVLIIAVFVILRNYSNDGVNQSLISELGYYFEVAILCAISYSIKQMYIVPPVVLFILCEIIKMIRKVSVRNIILFFIAVIICSVALLGYICIFNSQTSNGYNVFNNISNVTQRYFDYNKYTQEITVYDDEYQQKDQYSVSDGAGYFKIKYEMFKKHPLRFIETFVDNYLCLANVYRMDGMFEGWGFNRGPLQKHHVFYNIIISTRYGYVQTAENYAFCIWELNQAGIEYEWNARFDSMYKNSSEAGYEASARRMKPYRHEGNATVMRYVLANSVSRVLVCFTYTICTLIEFPVFILALILCIKKKTIRDQIMYGMICALSGSAFAHTMAMDITGCIIDRYIMPAHLEMLLCIMIFFWGTNKKATR